MACGQCAVCYGYNGPSCDTSPVAVEVHEATPEESARIAARDIDRALAELDEAPPSHIADHIRMHLRSALIWLGEA